MTLPKKILVVRNDRLGDFVLALPACALLKQALPDTEVHVLVPRYTREIAAAAAAIDDVLIDPGPDAGRRAQWGLLQALRRARYDAALSLYSTGRVGLLLYLARIPYRLAPATKLAQVFYNHRLRQRRSRSAKPEYAYNCDLAARLCSDFDVATGAAPAAPFLQFPAEQIQALREQFCQTQRIPPAHRLVFLHPGSGGSARNLSLPQYAALVRQLHASAPFTLIISCGPDEADLGRQLSAQLDDVPHRVYVSQDGLRRFAEHLLLADVFIGGSTGPLHLAGALDRPTAGFYTRRRSATSLRWQTLSRAEHRLAFCPPADAAEEDMGRIDLAAAAQAISRAFLS